MSNQNALRDENAVSSLIAILNSSGASTIRIKVNPITHALKINDDTTGSNNGPSVAMKDDNDVSTLVATSQNDGTTPVVAYANSSGELLVTS